MTRPRYDKIGSGRSRVTQLRIRPHLITDQQQEAHYGGTTGGEQRSRQKAKAAQTVLNTF